MFYKKLKTAFSVVIVFSLCFCNIVALGANSVSEDDIMLSSKTQSEVELIENKIENIAALRLVLENNNISKAEAININNEINSLKTDLEELGAKPSRETLITLVTAALAQMDSPLKWHPRDIVDQFDGAYDVWGYTTTYSGKPQYHLVFEDGGYETDLKKMRTQSYKKRFSSGSSGAQYWVNETLKVYAQKLIGSGLGLANPLINFTPWELFFSSQPSPNIISANSDSTIITLNTNSIQKFVFVYDSGLDDWHYALSVNKLRYSYTVTEAITISGTPQNESKDYNHKNVYGDYSRASYYANSNYNASIDTCRCIDEIAVRRNSNSSDYCEISIFTPRFVSHMIY